MCLNTARTTYIFYNKQLARSHQYAIFGWFSQERAAKKEIENSPRQLVCGQES